MLDIERLHRALAARFPGRAVAIDPAETPTGSWFVAVPRDGGEPPVVVEWRPDRGFGLSTPGPDDLGGGADEVFPDARATFDRVVELVADDALARHLASAGSACLACHRPGKVHRAFAASGLARPGAGPPPPSPTRARCWCGHCGATWDEAWTLTGAEMPGSWRPFGEVLAEAQAAWGEATAGGWRAWSSDGATLLVSGVTLEEAHAAALARGERDPVVEPVPSGARIV